MPKDVDYSFVFTLPPEKIVEYFKKKGYAISYNWEEVWQSQHHKVFTVAKAMNMDVLQTLRDSVEKSINEGITYQDFKKGLQGNLTNLGWWGSKKEMLNPNTGEVEKVTLGTPNRLRIIYETNLNVAYAVGNYEGMKANAEERPYWRYRAILDNNTRPDHAELHNKVYPHDHKFWSKYYPPNGWGCRCTVEALTKEEVKEFGYKVSRDLPKNVKVPKEWNFNPAKVNYQPDLSLYSKDISDAYKKGVGVVTEVGKDVISKEKINAIKTYDEAKQVIKDILKNNYGSKVKNITINKNLPIPVLKQYINQINELSKEYMYEVHWYHNKPMVFESIAFSSTKEYLGRCRPYGDGVQINFGHKNCNVSDHSILNPDEYDKMDKPFYFAKDVYQKARYHSLVDADKVIISTPTHEFFHMISHVYLNDVGDYERVKKGVGFWNEMMTLQQQYRKEIITSKSVKELSESFLGTYANTNLNEFGAEIFTEYKLSSNPTKYARLGGAIIDKYFKRGEGKDYKRKYTKEEQEQIDKNNKRIK